MAKSILIKQVKGSAQVAKIQKLILKSLGVSGLGSAIYRTDTRALRGALNKVQHLITAEQVEKSSSRRPKNTKSTQRGYKLA